MYLFENTPSPVLQGFSTSLYPQLDCKRAAGPSLVLTGAWHRTWQVFWAGKLSKWSFTSGVT